MTKDEALRLALEALEKLWGIIDDIDTYGDMAKADEKLYRTLVERRQRQRFEETGISTDGYELHGGAITAIKAALEAKDEPFGYFRYDLRLDAWVQSRDSNQGAAFYTTPPQRTWVGLTDDEIQQSYRLKCKEFGHWLDERAFLVATKWAEAKLKEKNT